ncbi:MAG: Flagellar motor switch protein FliN [Pelotomaculum sp. PtaU1.Bin035]|nr:MAG: Flagellar motor switch protein FliN [Pelotomaculum sp. PtaU1.Bin035]
MSNELLKQEEIDALLNNSNLEPARAEIQFEQPISEVPETEFPAEQEVVAEGLTDLEKDALGEIGNICMGSASTTLSMLLNQKVNITSPTVNLTTIEKLYESFSVPYMTIYIRYIEGLFGFNLLMMKLEDAAVLADLMMGGDGSSVSEEMTDIGISAASEAMNQMIGSASTSMASMFGRTVNISPPETIVYRNTGEMIPMEPIAKGPLVVVSFKMTIGDILDTQIMQVMGVDTAVEEAKYILGDVFQDNVEEQFDQEWPPVQEEVEDVEAGELPELAGDLFSTMQEDFPEPESPKPAPTGQKGSAAREHQPPAMPVSTRRPVAAPYGWDQKRLDMILDIPLKVTVLLGRTKWPIKDILGISPGSVVELNGLVDEPVEVLINGILVAMGEVVVVNENFGVRITNIIDPEERLKKLVQRKIP